MKSHLNTIDKEVAIIARGYKNFLGVLLITTLLALVWQIPALEQYKSHAFLNDISDGFVSSGYPFLSVLGAFLIASFILFPVSAVVILAAFALPGWQAVIATMLGVSLSSAVGYFFGKLLGPNRVQRLFGPLYESIRNLATKNVFATVFIVRHMPLAPFSIVNLVLGSMRLNFAPFILANSLSLVPGSITAVVVVNGIRLFA